MAKMRLDYTSASRALSIERRAALCFVLLDMRNCREEEMSHGSRDRALGGKRSVITPELPTIAESGVPRFRYYGGNGVIAPAAAPRAIIDSSRSAASQVASKIFYRYSGRTWAPPHKIQACIEGEQP